MNGPNVTFTRRGDAVVVSVVADVDTGGEGRVTGTAILYRFVFDSESWAQTVASVSAHEGKHEAWRAIDRFHRGDLEIIP